MTTCPNPTVGDECHLPGSRGLQPGRRLGPAPTAGLQLRQPEDRGQAVTVSRIALKW